MDSRRTLAFSSLAEIMPEVDRLLTGYEKRGQWSLGQICNHLGLAMQHTLEGFPTSFPWLVRKLIGPIARREIFRTGSMRTGLPIPTKVTPRPELDDRAEAEALRATIHFFLAAPGPLAPHPLLGQLTTAEWHRFHCIHSAHHLSFLQGNPSRTSPSVEK